MEIRLAKESEKEQIKQLWQYCFYDTNPYLSWFFDTVFTPDHAVVAVENGQIAGALQLLPYSLVLRRKAYPSYYIAGVSTNPRYRGMGVGRGIMEYAEHIARQRGASFLLLIPSVDGFYEKFGYVSCFEKMEYSFSPQAIVTKKFRGNIKKAEEADVDALLYVYQTYMRGFDGYIARDYENMKKIWQMYSHSAGGAYLFYAGGSPCGYMLYEISAKRMSVDEALYLNESAVDGVLWFMYSHHSQTQEVCLRAALHDIIANRLYHGGITAKKIPTVMLKSLSGGDPRLIVGQIDGEMVGMLYGEKSSLPLQKNYVNILT